MIGQNEYLCSKDLNTCHIHLSSLSQTSVSRFSTKAEQENANQTTEKEIKGDETELKDQIEKLVKEKEELNVNLTELKVSRYLCINPLHDMAILGSSNSAANKDIMSII